jgi:YfiH family protein
MRGEGFILREFKGIPYYSCRAFESLPGLCHGFSTRHGGVSSLDRCSLNLGNTPWDSPERIQENRLRFLSALRLEKARLTTLRQVHSNRVHIIEDISGQWNQSEGDALATRVENVALAVQVADCLPVLVADPVHNAVAAVHSGWRGTLSGVLPRTIQEMQRAFESDPAQLLVAIGPGIRACCYEVGIEVAERFEREYPGRGIAKTANARAGKYLLDLGRALDIQLNLAGICLENRHDLGACTRCNTNEFFSHRAEGTAAGRMMALISLRGNNGTWLYCPSSENRMRATV